MKKIDQQKTRKWAFSGPRLNLGEIWEELCKLWLSFVIGCKFYIYLPFDFHEGLLFCIYFFFLCNFTQFSKTAGQIKEAISNLPVATEDDDIEEADALKDETKTTDKGSQIKQDSAAEENNKQESDPFGLDALIPHSGKKGEKPKGKEAAIKIKEEDDTKRFLKSQREALIFCLEIAARRYKIPWQNLMLLVGTLFWLFCMHTLRRRILLSHVSYIIQVA